MKDIDFVRRLATEFNVCPAWSDVGSIATSENQEDLRPHELMIFLRPKHPEHDIIDAFKITVAWQTFPPLPEINGCHPPSCSDR